ncbi:hypothetical protein VTK73DRAFT_7329 [Phialemonium thermophilum]|uniref:BTB domain-containing protein n=1 Tax=Phialemonium thermophilum TaxID=223376 RepID=A0ABR3XTR2_9PEZI
MNRTIKEPTRARRAISVRSNDEPSKAADLWLSDRIVNVYVGREARQWSIHEKLFASKSSFFREEFYKLKNQQDNKYALGARKRPASELDQPDKANAAGNPITAQSMRGDEDKLSLELPGEDPKLFAVVVRWVYGVTFAKRCDLATMGTSSLTVRERMALYILACKLDIEGLKNAAVDLVYDHFHAGLNPGDKRRCPDMRDVQYVFDHTPEGSPLRRLLIVTSLFYLFSVKDPGEAGIELPQSWKAVLVSNGEIGFEIIKMANSWRWVIGITCPSMTIKKRCSFHEHTDGLVVCEE